MSRRRILAVAAALWVLLWFAAVGYALSEQRWGHAFVLAVACLGNVGICWDAARREDDR